jgi:hypothetical protein
MFEQVSGYDKSAEKSTHVREVAAVNVYVRKSGSHRLCNATETDPISDRGSPHTLDALPGYTLSRYNRGNAVHFWIASD